jgi:glutamate dehydrogenase
MEIFEELVNSEAPDDPMFERELGFYFPNETHKFEKAMKSHRLRREIIATRISNEIVDTCGATFMDQLMETSGAGFADVALSYEAARRILELSNFGAAVDALDNKAPASLQTDLYWTAVALLEEQVNKIISNVEAGDVLAKRGIKGVVDQYKEPIQSLKLALSSILPADEARALKERAQRWKEQGAPETLAIQAALMPALEFAFDIVNLSRATGWQAETIGAVFFAAGRVFSIEPARISVRDSMPEGHYDRLAANRLSNELSLRQGDLAIAIARLAKNEPAKNDKNGLDALFHAWREKYAEAAHRFERFANELDISAGMTIGKLSLMNQKLSELVERTASR